MAATWETGMKGISEYRLINSAGVMQRTDPYIIHFTQAVRIFSVLAEQRKKTLNFQP